MTTSSRAVTAPAPAREAAFTVLLRTEAAGAFATVLLFRTLQRSRLAAADRALATTLVLGVLRHRGRLDWALAAFLRRPLHDLPPAIRTILRLGAYQVLDLTRIPAAVAVDEAVALARRHGHPGTAGLVNAVLRRLSADGSPPPPDPAADPAGHLAVVHSQPRWLVERWLARWDAADVTALAAACTRPAPSVVRANTLVATPEEVRLALAARGVPVAAGLLPEALRVRGALTARLPLYARGLFAMQDEGAMVVARALAPTAGSVVIDACAAPGGKTSHLAALMRNTGRLVACDVHPGKLAALAHRCATMGASNVEAHHLDARSLGRAFPRQADAVLVDAPCTGLGVVRRRPDVKWRVAAGDLARCAALQREILAGAAGAVRSGGVLVYSVCSLEPEEGPDVVRAFLGRHPEFRFDSLPATVPRTVNGWPLEGAEAGEVLLLPHRHDTDGFYVARLARR
ncbi:MAG: 16S rRNA (cytosine(967)-C(5))-methyltransferase RsmB [Armatimonadota bacterium]|nr:16S rRNA (cytosine(967)-C(5))-methyltransferase RsmB [Armatimonadota bacterium]MDR7533938.1 16S rRNA (cytosine(967)-C(5))-methyltransferase RsmB [Armatimonadota bacterium]MDR7536048.1 16S rRNA (cytosine(967)-C(5))-methyltransferase RsmB [Armatimonadota bacterium]